MHAAKEMKQIIQLPLSQTLKLFRMLKGTGADIRTVGNSELNCVSTVELASEHGVIVTTASRCCHQTMSSSLSRKTREGGTGPRGRQQCATEWMFIYVQIMLRSTTSSRLSRLSR